MKERWLLVLLNAFVVSTPTFSKISIVTTTTNIESLVSEIGGDLVDVFSICKGSRDPHYIEAKPSYMVKVSRADLVASVGLDLEMGWLPSILRGARNPRVANGSKGYLEIGTLVDRLEIPTGKVSRAEGDIHPEGNPHVLLDPIRAGKIAVGIAKRLSELDSANAKIFQNRATAIKNRFAEKIKLWGERIKKSGVASVISHHKTLSYFFDRFGITVPIVLEAKPGIPPSSRHVIEVIKTAKVKKVGLILVENFFEDSVAQRIKRDVSGLRVEIVPVAVKGADDINSLDDLYEYLVSVIEGK